jgi:hypothetical protein
MLAERLLALAEDIASWGGEHLDLIQRVRDASVVIAHAHAQGAIDFEGLATSMRECQESESFDFGDVDEAERRIVPILLLDALLCTHVYWLEDGQLRSRLDFSDAPLAVVFPALFPLVLRGSGTAAV